MYGVSGRSVLNWRNGLTPRRLTAAWQREARHRGMLDVETFLAAREVEQELVCARVAYMGTAQLYALTGRWYLRRGGYRRFPDEPPPGLTEKQLALVAQRIKQGQSRAPAAKLPTIDWRRAARLQGKL